MTDFFRNLENASLLGEKIRAAREATGMTLDAVARQTHISLRYIRALESGDWRVFSAKVYAQGALKRVISVCKVEDASLFTGALDQEWEAAFPDARRGYAQSFVKNARYPYPWGMFSLTPRKIGVGVAAGALALVMGFWGMRLVAFAAPPTLRLDEPRDLAGYEAFSVTVRGRTEKESRLTVNGRELTLDELGHFDEKIELPPGVHELRFMAQNRFGKEQIVVRNILVK